MKQEAAQLIEPPPVHFAPVTPGWYVSGAVLLLLLAALAVLCIRHYLQNRYRREALRQLEAITAAPNVLYEANMLLKRIAMRNYGRSEVAALQGDDWMNFLNGRWKEAAFTTEEGKAVSDGLYRPPGPEIPAAFLDKCRRWLRKHRR